MRKLFSFRTGVFVAAAIAAVCSDTGCHNCQMRLPSSLQNWDVDVTLKEQTPAPPIFPRCVSKAHVFGVKRKLGGWGWDSRHRFSLDKKDVFLGRNMSLLDLFEEFSQHVHLCVF